MKKAIHPKPYFTRVMMTDGSTYVIRSTRNQDSLFWKLDQDSKSHSFWFGPSSSKNIEWQDRGQRAKFKKRFSRKQ